MDVYIHVTLSQQKLLAESFRTDHRHQILEVSFFSAENSIPQIWRDLSENILHFFHT